MAKPNYAPVSTN